MRRKRKIRYSKRTKSIIMDTVDLRNVNVINRHIVDTADGLAITNVSEAVRYALAFTAQTIQSKKRRAQ